jgi:hypothetical protein
MLFPSEIDDPISSGCDFEQKWLHKIPVPAPASHWENHNWVVIPTLVVLFIHQSKNLTERFLDHE